MRCIRTTLIPIILLLAFMLVSAPDTSRSQEKVYALYGRVFDAESGNPLPHANIRIAGTSRGTISNEGGFYTIILQPESYDIIFSYMGFRSDTLSVTITDREIERDISLKPATFNLDMFTVAAERFNDAEKIIVRAIEKKEETQSLLKSYQFEAYTKTIIEEVKTVREKPDTSIACILESQIEGYWKRRNNYKEIITARRQTANIPAGLNMITIAGIPNFNHDKIVLGQFQIIGPTAGNALDYYNYDMIDTTAIDDIPVYRIRMTPKTGSRPLFDGVVSIAGNTYSIMQVDVTLNEALDIAQLTDIRYKTDFSLYQDIFWMPGNVIFFVSVESQFSSRIKTNFEITSVLHNYTINQPLGLLFDNTMISVAENADDIDSTQWQAKQQIPLTNREKATYAHLDRIYGSNEMYQRLMGIAFNGLPDYKNFTLSSFSDIFHFNKVEGAYLGLGVNNKKLIPLSSLYASAGYGFADNTAKYDLKFVKDLSRNKRLSLGFNIFRKLETADFLQPYSVNTISLAHLFEHIDYYTYYLNEGWEISGSVRPASYFRIETALFGERHESAVINSEFSVFNRGGSFRTNPSILEGAAKGARITLNYDTRQYIDIGVWRMQSQGRNSWNITGEIEYSDKSSFGSDFSYTRYTASVFRRQSTYGAGYLDVMLHAGTADGSLPPQRAFDVPARLGVFYPFWAFKTLPPQYFSGDRIAAAKIEHNFGTYFFERLNIPLLRKQKWEFIINAGAAWTENSDQTENMRVSRSHTTGPAYIEAGIGIGRIFSFLRFDITWRISDHTTTAFRRTVGSPIR
ncbi:DUF5686 family protein [candidate division KSB1 bacterium]